MLSRDPPACAAATIASAVFWASGSFARCEGGVPGLFDMSGNAWEWSAECDGSDYCTIVSGGYTDEEGLLSCQSMVFELGSIEQPDLGFRCCRSL